MNRRDILIDAATLITGDRQDDYGDAQESFNRIAQMWSAYLGCTVVSTDVANMMVLLKVCRTVSSPEKLDSYVDMAGYAALAGEMATDKEK